MEKYFKFLERVDYVISFISSTGAVLIYDILKKNICGYSILIIFIALSCALIIFILISFILKGIFRSSGLVKKWILKEDYIEGVWQDVTYESNKITGGGIINIKIEGDSIKVDGDNYEYQNGTCRKKGRFWSTMSIFSDKNLEFAYKSNNRSDDKDAPGFTRYRFSSVGSQMPVHYDGFFFNSNNKDMIIVEAEKIVDKKKVRLLSSSNEKIKTVKEFIEKKR